MLTRTELAAVVAALAPRVRGGQVQKVREPDAHTLVLRVRRPGENIFLVLSCAPGAARLAEAADAGATLPEPTALAAWVRATLAGRRLVSLSLDPVDRVVTLGFEGGRLVLELTGRDANLVGVDADDRVVALAHRPPDARGLTTGGPYHPPPPPPDRPAAPPRLTDPRAVEIEAQRLLADRVGASDEVARERLARQVRRRLERLRAKVQADLERTRDADRWRYFGELLKSQQHRIERSATAVQVQDWYAEGAPLVEVPVDPALDAAANVARLFTRYRKAQVGAERAAARLAEVDAQRALLERLCDEHPDADGLATALRQAGLHRAPAAAGVRRAKGPPRRQAFRGFTSRAGERILVGRGGADNHTLTFQIARGNDHWLHARDASGAHVVVPQPARGQDPKPDTLRDAAALAAHHSDLRGEPVVDVSVTRRKHVRAVPGAAPGRVTVADARTITVDDVEDRVARLYAAAAEG